MKKKRGATVSAFLLLTCSLTMASPISAAAHEASFPVRDTDCESCAAVGVRDDVAVSSRFLELLFGKRKDSEKGNEGGSAGEVMLCPGGDVFGVKIARESVSVISADEECILKRGDIIISIDGEQIRSLSDIKKILKSSDGSPLDLVIERGSEKFEAEVIPKKSGEEYKLGAVLRDGVAGIGTVTYYDPATGEFGGLGHGICEEKTGEPVRMKSGTVTGVILGGVDKSEAGDPGELTGILTEEKLGELYSNTEEGVFGKLTSAPDKERAALPIAHRDEVKEGEATIISTLKNGHRAEYKIEIFDIDKSSTETKSFKIRVTDDALKTITGGIVRGMSGSPIIQNGKLVGAVTHVMLSDPTEGYGIFIENMLSAAKPQVQPRAA